MSKEFDPMSNEFNQYHNDKNVVKTYKQGKYTVTISDEGTRCWFYKDVWHRENNKPACVWTDGFKAWYINGERHRENGPAVEWENDEKEWWLNDEIYTENDYKFEIRNRKLKTLGI